MQQDYFKQILVDALPIGAAIFTGPLHTINAANAEMLDLWSKNPSVIGKNLHDALPEIKDQPFFDLLTNVYHTGEVFHDPAGQAQLLVNGVLQAVYFDYWLKPLKNEHGVVVGVMNTAVNTTAKVKEQQRAQQAVEELREAVVKLNRSNAALQTANEQLNAAKEATQLGLFDWDLIRKIYNWDARFKQMFGLSSGYDPDHYEIMVERLHPDDRERVKKAVQDAQNEALSGGKYDIEYRIIGAGDVPVRWARALGKVIFNDEGTPVRFIGTLMDITEQVLNRRKLEASEERLRLAIESANLGTWFINAQTREFMPSLRLKELFGYYPGEDMPYDAAITQISEEYRDKVTSAVNAAIEKGESYDLEYPIIGFHDHVIRWVRATGKLYPGSNTGTPYFSGTHDGYYRAEAE